MTLAFEFFELRIDLPIILSMVFESETSRDGWVRPVA